MISSLWAFIFLAHTCHGQPGYGSMMPFRRPDADPEYVRGESAGRGPPSRSLDFYDVGVPYDAGYPRNNPVYDSRYPRNEPAYGTGYPRGEPPPYEYNPGYNREYVPSRIDRLPGGVDFDNVFAGRYEQFRRPTPRLPRRQPPRRVGRRRSRQQVPRRRRQQRTREIVRQGYVGARGGVEFFPFMGGYCAGEMCSDGGQAAGVGDGIGTGSKTEMERRRRTGQNEDVRVYEMHVRNLATTQ